MDGILGRVVAIVLGLLALAGVGLAGYKAFATNKSSTVVTDMTQVATNARAQFSQNNNGYTNFTTANATPLVNAGIIPGDMVRAGGIFDAWGNAVQFAPVAGNTEGQITFGGGGSETVEQCSHVLTSLTDYVSLVVNGTTFSQANQPDAVSAANACAGTPKIILTFQ
ncbi:type 4 pilus major pilin [Trinickia fusca]|uniref:Prepilin type IV pili n=1 Tax=Trinickia fusca TaxID=2419777 RepID=A0A494XA05_9BURK|nr:type 4 pilus major pilin [Trinickia fusca]RKP47565.1 prepilin type IV pili [Trinickia fusca]